MAIEIAALLAGINAVSGLVDASMKIVGTIRRGLSSANAEAKQQLQARLNELVQSLVDIGGLAKAASAYLAALNEVRNLEVDALLLEEYLDHSGDVLRNHLSPTYDPSWSTVTKLLDTFDRDRSLAIQVHLNRKDFLDETDDQMVGTQLNDVNAAYGVLVERVENRHYGDVRSGLQALQKPLRNTRELLQNTLANRILPGIEQLRQVASVGGPGGTGGPA